MAGFSSIMSVINNFVSSKKKMIQELGASIGKYTLEANKLTESDIKNVLGELSDEEKVDVLVQALVVINNQNGGKTPGYMSGNGKSVRRGLI